MGQPQLSRRQHRFWLAAPRRFTFRRTSLASSPIRRTHRRDGQTEPTSLRSIHGDPTELACFWRACSRLTDSLHHVLIARIMTMDVLEVTADRLQGIAFLVDFDRCP